MILPFYAHLIGQLPGGKNAQGRAKSGVRYAKDRFKEWREGALADLQHWKMEHKSNGGELPFIGPLSIEVSYFPGDSRRRDVPGMMDALCHVLEHGDVKIVEDDGQLIEWLWRPFEGDESEGGVRILIEPREQVRSWNARHPKRRAPRKIRLGGDRR